MEAERTRRAVAAALRALVGTLAPEEQVGLPALPVAGQPEAVHAVLAFVQDLDDRFAADHSRCRREDPRAGLTSRLAPALVYLRDAERALLAGNVTAATADLARAAKRAEETLALLPQVQRHLSPPDLVAASGARPVTQPARDTAQPTRQQREAAALRENLQRRKEQARARTTPAGLDPDRE